MIQIHIREHGTHNQGYGFDFEADLNDYNDANTLLEDLYEYTREKLEENGIRNFDENMEEYLITDWEFENTDFEIDINEYSSLSELINTNEKIENFDNSNIKLLSLIMKNEGFDIDEALDIINNGEIYSFNGTLEDWAYEMVEEGLFGEINKSIINYIDYEKIARDLSMDGYCEVDSDFSYHIN